MTTTITTDYVLAGAQEFAGVNEDAVLVQGSGWNAITINGRITVNDASKGLVFGARVGAADINTGSFSGVHTFTIGVSGVVSVTTTVTGGGTAGGVVGYDAVKVVNLGRVEVHGQSEASGVGGSRLGIENRGTITVEAGRSTLGVSLNQGGPLLNTGTISAASGTIAHGGALGVLLLQPVAGFTSENSGTIRATHADPAASSTGVAMAGFVDFVNSGVIEADRVLQFNRDGIISGGGRHANVTNTGVLRGEVFLNNTAFEPVMLRNSGRIEGEVFLNTGVDTYSGAGGTVTGVVHGDTGTDSLLGGSGAETLSGDGGDDTIDGGAGGADLLDGGAGGDVLSFANSAVGVTLNVAAQTVSSGVRFSNFETYAGSERDDAITGSATADLLYGLGGADTINGGAGDDRIIGGDGASYLRGDDGNDSLLGGASFDDINGNMGSDTVATGAAEDYCVGGKDNDSLSGGADYDLVYGNLGADTCMGDDGNDIVRGGQDNDLVNGGNGDDFVSGDKGDDTMTGGAGADIFHTFGDAGLDRVTDFNAAQGDRVQLDPGTQYTLSQVGFDTVIDMVGGGRMVLLNVSFAGLAPGWIFGA